MLNLALSIEVGYLSPMREAAYRVMPVLMDAGDPPVRFDERNVETEPRLIH